LIDLVERKRIAAVSYLATDPLSSAKPDRAKGLRSTKGAAEDVLAYKPDLVLAGEYSTPATVDLLRRLGHHVELLPMPDSLDGIRKLIRKVAAATGDDPSGEALIRDFDRRIDLVRARTAQSRSRPRALVYQVNNFVSRSGSLIDEMLQIAGFDNAAKDLPGGHSGAVAIESIVTRPPDLLILASGPDTYLTGVADNLRHPALQRTAQSVATMLLPWPLWLCGTHHVADAIEKLADAHDALPIKP
jgi:iron complex transport system substrate-binding protein